MDLTKAEISVLILEDLMRIQGGFFNKYLEKVDLSKKFGSNNYPKKIDVSDIEKIHALYDKFVFEKGFTFDEQFKITKKTSDMLKSDLSWWNRYVSYLKKKDKLVKENKLYSHVIKIYPSPEFQLNWLLPQKKSDI